jgi:hypothetical protein
MMLPGPDQKELAVDQGVAGPGSSPTPTAPARKRRSSGFKRCPKRSTAFQVGRLGSGSMIPLSNC